MSDINNTTFTMNDTITSDTDYGPPRGHNEADAIINAGYMFLSIFVLVWILCCAQAFEKCCCRSQKDTYRRPLTLDCGGVM